MIYAKKFEVFLLIKTPLLTSRRKGRKSHAISKFLIKKTTREIGFVWNLSDNGGFLNIELTIRINDIVNS